MDADNEGVLFRVTDDIISVLDVTDVGSIVGS
jgi:hypothetical protein